MRNFAAVFLLWLALWPAPAAGAEIWTVDIKLVSGRVSYSRAQDVPLGKQSNSDGKARARGGGPERGLQFDSFLNPQQGGLFRLDYLVELDGEQPTRPPFQAAGKVLLRPGKPLLAAEAAGWKLILELRGEAGEKTARPEGGTLKTSLKCGRASYPAEFVYLPDQQYSAVLYDENGGMVRKFMVGLLPNGSGADGTFLLQYTLLLKEGPETVAESGGDLVLAPGGGKETAAAGKNCVFSAKAAR